MLLARLLDGIEIKESAGVDYDAEIKDISSDSNKVNADSLFVCIKGIVHDGHNFISQAIESGARIIILEQKGAAAIKYPYIQVDNTRAALSKLWHNFYGKPGDRLKIVAVTGTNGKTSTVAILSGILRAAGHKTGVIGTVTNSMTTPDPEQLYKILKVMADGGFKYVCMEASSHALALDKLAPLNFEAGIFTNLTQDHLDFHADMEDYRRAKAKLFRRCKTGVFNFDDEKVRLTAEESNTSKLYYSAESAGCDYNASNISLSGADGVKYSFAAENKYVMKITSLLVGMFGVYNTLAAASCADALGVPPGVIAGALRVITGVPGRLERVPLKNSQIAAYIDYAHTPDALEKALACLRGIMDGRLTGGSVSEGRLTVVFGCGGDRDAAKRPLMGAIASRLADFTVITSDNSRSEDPAEIIRQIMRGVDKERPHTVIENRRDAIFYAVRNARPGDFILFAGKGHETYEITRSGKHHFDEREIIAAAQEQNL